MANMKEINQKMLELLQLTIDSRHETMQSNIVLLINRFSQDEATKTEMVEIVNSYNKGEVVSNGKGENEIVFSPSQFKKKPIIMSHPVAPEKKDESHLESENENENHDSGNEDAELIAKVKLFQELHDMDDKDLMVRFKNLKSLKNFAKHVLEIKLKVAVNKDDTIMAVRKHIDEFLATQSK